MKLTRWMELTSWAVGLVVLISYAALRVSAEQERRAGVQAFEALRKQVTPAPVRAGRLRMLSGRIDQSLWSKARVRAFSRTTLHELPEGILRIPALHLVVPIYPGTTPSELNRGAGHVQGTDPLDSAGNAVIAGHRDGFFRSLERIKPGQTLYVETLEGTRSYRVVKTQIVRPSDVSVLASTALPSVTLITCYPFYFAGPAPRRFIVRAVAFHSRRHAADERTAGSSQRQE